MLPNGTVFQAGAHDQQRDLYASTGTWAVAPAFGSGLDIADGPAAVLPDGNALFDTSPGVFETGSVFFEWDGKNLTKTSAPPNAHLDSSYVGNMVVLPTGQILFTDFTSDVEIYTPSGSACKNCAPTITTAPTTIKHGATNVKITGTQFNGLDQGAYYGDDNQAATNFPIVRITDSTGAVVYCKSHSWVGGVATGSKVVSTQIDVPSTIHTGTATLVVIANGIASAPKTVTIN